MKYVNALQEKGLKKEDLSKAIQKKIEKAEQLEKQGKEDELLEIDIELEKSIIKFNPEVYKKRLEHTDKLHGKDGGEVPNKVPSKPKAEQPKNEVESVVKSNLKKINENLDELKTRVEINRELFQAEEEQVAEEVEAEELEDFKKTQEVKPKKMSTSFILMGVGAFLLTWGAVNLWRERR
jgi:hypothetical protein